MGQEITYCSKCQNQLRSVDFEKSRAFRIDGVNFCADCVPSAERSALETKLDEEPRTVPAERPPSHGTHRAVAREGAPSSTVFGVLAVVVVVGVALVAMLLPGGKPPPAEVRTPVTPAPIPAPEVRPPTTPPVERPETPVVPVIHKPETAKESLRKAREFAKAHPDNWAGQRTLYDQAAWDARGTDLLETARAEREAVLKGQRDAFAAEAKTIADRLAPRLEREEFGAVLADWRDARGVHSEAEWTAVVDRHVSEVRARAEGLFAALKEKGTPAKDLRDRVARWGLPELAGAIVDPPAPPPAPPESDTVQQGWRAAMELAAGRDYAAAVKELDRIRQETSTPALKAELAADLEAMRALAAAMDEAAKALARLPKGQKIALSRIGEPRLEGVIVRAEPGRLIVKSGEEIVGVPMGEIAGASWAEMVQMRAGAKPAHLVSCLEGDLEGARKYGGDPAPRFAAFAASAAQRAADPREAEARRRFVLADNESVLPAAAAGAVEKIAVLLKDFGDTFFVRRNVAMIRSRLESGKEHVFFPDLLLGSGTFRMGRAAKLDSCWVSEADNPKKDSFVELVFAPLPATDYRCWVYVGACCGETFEFSFLATEMADAEPVKHSISTASRKHTSHNGPKQPSRWGWASLPLPKFTLPGPKKVRVLTEHQGFSVAFAVVSSTRTAAPTESEIREWERARAAEPPRYPADPSLVAYYNCDAGTGTKLLDQTRNGNHGVLKGAAWVPGKMGKALEFDGVSAYVKIPTSASFDSCAKQVTLAAWVYRKSVLPGARILIGRQLGPSWDDQWNMAFNNDGGSFSIGIKRIMHTVGLPGGEWIHMASTYDGSMMQFYVNGTAISGHKPPSPAGLVVEAKPVTLGAGMNKAGDEVEEHFHGLIDEVRIYNRALSAAEIAELVRSGKP